MDEAKKLCKDVLIKPFEGLAKRLPDGRVTAYPDPGTRGHPWTIGWGATGPDINPGTVWTMQQCEEALDHHIEYFVQGIIKIFVITHNPLVNNWADNIVKIFKENNISSVKQ